MKLLRTLLFIVISGVVALAGAFYAHHHLRDMNHLPPAENSIYDFTMRDIDGNEVDLDTYKGKVVMIVNVASKCGYTPQYEGLESLYERNKDRGFVILGFPANNFMGQEPGTDAEIKTFCSTKYNVTFPMFSKISVSGDDQHPLYNYLTNKDSDPDFSGPITWNFNKFLIDRNGKIVERFATGDEPESEKVTSAVDKYLSAS